MGTVEGKDYSILIVDDEEGIRHGLRNLFEKESFIVYTEELFIRATQLVREHAVDVAVLDVRLKGGKTGIDLLEVLKEIEPEIVVIIITGYGSIDTAVTSMKNGAAEYILKPVDNRKLLNAVYKNLEIRNLKNENYFLKKELINRYPSHQFVTNDPHLCELLGKADKIKNNPVTVLITGESGTGKEILARYIHFTSDRRNNRFVGINCAALSESLLLSELFGHEKGSFTGAIERRQGKFEIANNGTLFLDEIGDMSSDIQAKLLRVIEENSFERLGGAKRIQVDVRIIAATNKDIHSLIEKGLFREDLFYRLNVVSFHLPRLCRRKIDIPLLANHFIEKYNTLYKKRAKNISNDAVEALKSYSWPGNIRELENVINQAVLLGSQDSIGISDLTKSIFSFHDEEPDGIDFSCIQSLKTCIEVIKQRYEKEIIRHFLAINNNNKTKTARDLSITRKTLFKKIKEYNVEVE